LHPLYALTGSGSSYQPAGTQAFSYDPTPTLALGNSIGQFGSRFADLAEREGWFKSGQVVPGEIQEVVPRYHNGYDYGPGDRVGGGRITGRDLGIAPSMYGIRSGEFDALEKYRFPGIGTIYAPASGGNFSEALEGVESIVGQGLLLYANKHLAKKALEWLRSLMPSRETRPYSTEELMEIGRQMSNVVAP